MQTRKWQGRAFAWSVVLAWHALVAWWLWHGIRLPRGGDASGLEVVYLELPQAPPSPPPQAVATLPAALRVEKASTPPPATAPVESTQAVSAATVLRQARALAEARDPPAFAAPDPLADRGSRYAHAPPDRFRTRVRITPALVLSKIGKIVGGPGYDADPCPRNRRNIERLLAAGDSAELRMDLEYEREHCRP